MFSKYCTLISEEKMLLLNHESNAQIQIFFFTKRYQNFGEKQNYENIYQ